MGGADIPGALGHLGVRPSVDAVRIGAVYLVATPLTCTDLVVAVEQGGCGRRGARDDQQNRAHGDRKDPSEVHWLALYLL